MLLGAGLGLGLLLYFSLGGVEERAQKEASLPSAKSVETPARNPIEVPESSSGQFDVVSGTATAADSARRVRFRVKIEQGLTEALGVAADDFASTVHRTLNDPRSWGQGSRIAFERTDGEADFDVLLATPKTTNSHCRPLRTLGRLSCHQGGKVVINARRWMTATPEFTDLQLYRQYLINHEVGHFLGNRHQACPKAGHPAPVMQPQTKRVAPCVPNAWPHI